jgi:hypothetical protein
VVAEERKRTEARVSAVAAHPPVPRQSEVTCDQPAARWSGRTQYKTLPEQGPIEIGLASHQLDVRKLHAFLASLGTENRFGA